ncbi:DUF2953 domain-containing protein [Metabacillus malikii]|uniref:DUF2953 domain-containing protein n=1 Tax=Metabacillus malikii TaxID=1504265 RepID=A0ABT9ZFK9_9BACI|nr:DUF2953 domain-containing protein [Metabacillus malikii]MDQ0231047.1 hypothetical protein [Metabacillus malikii]
MRWVLYIILALILLLIILLFTKVTITIQLRHVGDDDRFKIKARAWFGILRYTIDIPFVKVDENGPNLIIKQKQKVGKEKKNHKVKESKEKVTPEESFHFFHDVKAIMEHIVGIHKIIRRFLKKVKVKKLEWHSQIGIGDAAHTGVLTGAVWSIKGGVIALIRQYMKVTITPVVSITPEFNQICSRTKLECMIQFRIGQAMLAGIQFIKYWRGGKPKLKSKPLSTFSNES